MNDKYLHLTTEVMKEWDVPEVSPDLAKNILSATEDMPQSVPWYKYWEQSKWFPITAIAATSLAVVLVIGGLSIPTQQQSRTQTIKQSFALIEGPSMKIDEVSVAANYLGLEIK